MMNKRDKMLPVFADGFNGGPGVVPAIVFVCRGVALNRSRMLE